MTGDKLNDRKIVTTYSCLEINVNKNVTKLLLTHESHPEHIPEQFSRNTSGEDVMGWHARPLG